MRGFRVSGHEIGKNGAGSSDLNLPRLHELLIDLCHLETSTAAAALPKVAPVSWGASIPAGEAVVTAIRRRSERRVADA